MNEVATLRRDECQDLTGMEGVASLLNTKVPYVHRLLGVNQEFILTYDGGRR